MLPNDLSSETQAESNDDAREHGDLSFKETNEWFKVEPNR
jgi:hypothetical protein